jgi:hypothetical protein
MPLISGGMLYLYSKKNKQTAFSDSDLKYPYFTFATCYNPKFEKRFKNGEDSNTVSSD